MTVQLEHTVRPAWFDNAACKGQTHLFFGSAREDHYRRVRRELAAHAICQTCPALQPCRAWARERHEIGYWGAENDEQRSHATRSLA